MKYDEVVKHIRENADEDGVFSFGVNSKYKRYVLSQLSDPSREKMVEWVKEHTGVMLSIKGYNMEDVLVHRLRKNNLISKLEIDGKVVDAVYSASFQPTKNDDAKTAEKKMLMRHGLYEIAKRNKMTIVEYFDKCLKLKYVRGSSPEKIEDKYAQINDWIRKNIEGNDADSLKDKKGFAQVYDWLRVNWEIKNPKILAPFVDYIVYNFKEYSITGRVKVFNPSKIIYNQLCKLYPNGVVTNLETTYPKLYNLIVGYRKNKAQTKFKTIKEFVEEDISMGKLKYRSTSGGANKKRDQIAYKDVREGLANCFGKGNIEKPVFIDFFDKDVQKRKEKGVVKTKLYDFCSINGFVPDDVLMSCGYVRENKLTYKRMEDVVTNKDFTAEMRFSPKIKAKTEKGNEKE